MSKATRNGNEAEEVKEVKEVKETKDKRNRPGLARIERAPVRDAPFKFSGSEIGIISP